MFSRLLSIPVLLAAAVAVPYVATKGPNLGELWDTLPASVNSNFDFFSASAPSPTPSTGPPQGPDGPLYSTTTPLEGLRSLSLPEIFRFDVTREWIYQRWARKSTALADLGLYGIRVPLVSGTQLVDLAGSLTYYFDAVGQLQRISFHGNTGDTTQLVMLLTQSFGLQPQQTPIAGEQLFQSRGGEDVYSELRTRPAPVLWANSPHDSFSVDLQLQRPGATTPLPARNLALPAPDQTAARPQVAAPENAIPQYKDSAKKEGKERWNAFFPRSRVPKGQVNSLEKRDRLW